MVVKSISVPNDVKVYLDGLPNASKYVVDLIQKDRQGGGADLDQRIARVLSELLKHQPMPATIVADSGESFKNELEDLLNM